MKTTVTNEMSKSELPDDALRMSLFKLSDMRKPPVSKVCLLNNEKPPLIGRSGFLMLIQHLQ